MTHEQDTRNQNQVYELNGGRYVLAAGDDLPEGATLVGDDAENVTADAPAEERAQKAAPENRARKAAPENR